MYELLYVIHLHSNNKKGLHLRWIGHGGRTGAPTEYIIPEDRDLSEKEGKYSGWLYNIIIDVKSDTNNRLLP